MKIESAMASPAGQLLARASDISLFCEKGIPPNLSEITAEEAMALKAIWSEQDRYQVESHKEAERQARQGR